MAMHSWEADYVAAVPAPLRARTQMRRLAGLRFLVANSEAATLVILQVTGWLANPLCYTFSVAPLAQ